MKICLLQVLMMLLPSAVGNAIPLTELLHRKPQAVGSLLSEISQHQEPIHHHIQPPKTRVLPQITVATDDTLDTPSSLPTAMEHLQANAEPDPLIRAHFTPQMLPRPSLPTQAPSEPIAISVGEHITLNGAQKQIFIRDESLLAYRHGELVGLAGGQTEIYIIENSQMHIIPVGVEEEVETQVTTLKTAGHNDLALAAAEKIKHLNSDLDVRDVQNQNVPVQVLDGQNQQVVPGLEVQIVGDENIYTTNEKGQLEDLLLPEGARLWVTITDPLGRYTSTISEAEASQGLQIIQVLPKALIESTSRLLDIEPPHSDHGLLCLDVQNAPQHASLAINPEPFATVSFDEAGLPVQTQQLLDSNRICFWGAPADQPILVSMTDHDTQEHYSFPTMVHPGWSSVMTWDLDQKIDKALATVHDSSPWGGSSQPVENPWIEPLGDYEELVFEDTGCGYAHDIALNRGRAWFLSREDLYEPLLYQYDQYDTTPWNLHLIERGFLERLSGDIIWDQELASLLIEHHPMGGQKADLPDIKVIGTNGQEFADIVTTQTASAAYVGVFNLPPGSYNVLMSDSDGSWIQGQSLLVYEGTTSFLQTGSRTRSLSQCRSVPSD